LTTTSERRAPARRTAHAAGPKRSGHPESDPLWYKDAIIYELRVGAFQDSDADGKGDFRGLTSRLDYLQDLGVTALWLLPFYPSPLRDDGYDISDFRGIHPDSGTLEDFKDFLAEAHRRQLRVITELVINHTSDQHAWFQRARRAAPASRWRDFYVWSEKPDRYPEARIIFRDFETSNWTWDPIARAHYWHRFYSHQPDLNFDSPDVRRAVLRTVDYWLGMGVDGLRLDAVPYLYERDGSHCENLPETHAFLRELRSHIDARFADRMLLGEANQWPEDASAYFGSGGECHMAFHFPLMPRLFMALHMEDRFPILDILAQTPVIPDSCQWALFLRNHDELTLEMVTDEERDYMYRVYAHDAQARINLGIRRRLAPLLGNDRRRIELMNALMFSLPGTPVIYYGDEIGMGDNFYLGDRNGVRTPMQWSSDRNAGFSRANPQRLFLPVILDPEYHYESINVEAQQGNRHSLLHWMKRLIALRKRHRALGRGSLEFLMPGNRKVIAFLRTYGQERILVVANLSRFVQYAEIDLSAYRGMTPVELFGATPFPPAGAQPYLFTLGPHAFYWFSLQERDSARIELGGPAPLPQLRVDRSWSRVLRGPGRESLEAVLPALLQPQRWFGGKARRIESARVVDSVPVVRDEIDAAIALVEVAYTGGERETYVLPLAFAPLESAAQLRERSPGAVLAQLEVRGRDGAVTGVLYDALEDPSFCRALMEGIAGRRRWRGQTGEIAAAPIGPFRQLAGEHPEALTPTLLRGEQSNSSVRFGEQLILKLFRRLPEGINPELEIGRFLTEQTDFDRIAAVAGALEYRVPRRDTASLGILQQFVPNEGDAWRWTLDHVQQFFERALVRRLAPEAVPVPRQPLLDLIAADPPPLVLETISGYLESARLLGQRTAEMHLALGSRPDDPVFAPEPFGALYQRSLYQSLRNRTRQALQLLAERHDAVPAGARADAQRLLGAEERLLACFDPVRRRGLRALRIRCHGDYHLGQVLWTGSDFVFIDFEGEPAASLGDRRVKRSPLRDVAGMLRSFDYAAHAPLFSRQGAVREADVSVLQLWACLWGAWVGSAFLRAYLNRMGDSPLLPRDPGDLRLLLRALRLEKNVYELAYELNNRPEWVAIPVRGILQLLEVECGS
jgi:maltose alpha-D-glucosyltransferase/alpha-amylase